MGTSNFLQSFIKPGMIKQAKHLYEFGPFRLHPAERMLLRDGEPLPLTPKAFDTLLVLIENSGHVVEKDELMQKVWPDTIVEEATLAQNIFTLRKALGVSETGGQYIETVPKHGYRFVTETREPSAGDSALIVERHTRSRITTEEETLPAEQIIEHQMSGARARLNNLRSIRSGLILSGSLVLMTGLAIALFYISGPSGETAPGIRSIAVLPAKPLVAEKRDESLELGLAATLITKLSSTGQIIVPSINSVSKYASPDQDPLAAGRELKVDAVLESSILWEEEKIRVMGRLLRVTDGATLWAGKCDQRCSSIFEVHDLVSEEIVRALGKHLTVEQQRQFAKRDTENAEAYRLYSKGLYHMFRRTLPDTDKAISYFEQATGLDAEYAQAWYGLAFSYSSVGDLGGVAPNLIMPKVKSALTRALELDDQLAEAHAMYGYFLISYERDWSAARREYERAIELSPGSAYPHFEFGWYLMCLGRFDEAIREMQTAVELEPASPFHNRNLGFTLFFARQYDRAIGQLMKTLDLDPNYESAYGWLGDCYLEKGDYDRAVETYLKAATISGRNPEAIKAMREVYERRGWRGYLQERVGLMEDKAKRGYMQPDRIAIFYARLGERDRALEMLEKACDERQFLVTTLNVSPWWDSLRSDPRFQDLLRRTGIPH